MTQEDYMRRALELAKKGEGRTSPNPLVGCVIVKNGHIIGEGYHERYGGPHAERNALQNCSEDPEGADLYVTLEPCCHTGNTPPCTDLIIEKKIKRVFMSCTDVNPKVGGKGARRLRDAGIEVEEGLLEEEALRQNEIFFHYMRTGTPFTAMKYAMSMDGKTACACGDSQWITGEDSRHYVHELRRRYSAVMVGIGTVLQDDPMLNCRIDGGTDPVRVICDSRLLTPLDSKIVQTADRIPTIVACTTGALFTAEGKLFAAALQQLGIKLMAAGNGPHVDLPLLMRQLGAAKIDSVLLEGGGTLNAAALQAGIVQKVYAFVGGKLIGGKDARTPVEGTGARTMDEALELQNISCRSFQNDILMTGDLPERKS